MRNLFLSLCLVGWLTCGSVQAYTLYVSPAGDDTWSGSLPSPNAELTDGPLASLQGALDTLRELRADGRYIESVDIQIQAGHYFLTEPLLLQPQDANVTFTGVGDERPVISGGEQISDWREESPGLWVAQVPQAQNGDWPLRSLYVNGERAILARSPNTDYFRTVGKAAPVFDADGNELDFSNRSFRYKSSEMPKASDLDGANAVVFFHWETGLLPIKSIDETTNTVTFTGAFKWAFWSNQRYYVENFKAALDAPGEFYLDRAEGLLYYKPRPGEDMTTAQVIAPRLQQLVIFQGDPEIGLTVSDVHFENLSFAHTNYILEPEGHSDWQAAVTVDAAIQASGANNCAFTNCEISHLGNYAIAFNNACTDNEITQCYIHDCSAGGVKIGGQGVPNEQNITSGNRVSDCLIRDLGRDFYGAIPVWIGHASDNIISHNEICDANYTGISCGWTWGYGPSAAYNNIIEYNYLHHLGRGRLCDMAAIYTLGIQPGTVVRNNLIHDIYDWTEGYGAGGIYPDEGSSQIVIENNVVYRTASGGLTVHYGQDNICRNNIFAFGRDNQIHLGRRDKESSLTLENNIIYFDEGVLMSRESDLKSAHNIYWQTKGEKVTFPLDQTFEQWQQSGQDIGSLIIDPKFVNPEQFDFSLQPDSPALQLGFKPIDISTCGITGPATLVKLARSIKREASVIPRRTLGSALTLNEDFENVPVGLPPETAVVWGEEKNAKIRVTQEQAAEGKRSLRFEDGPGLEQVYNPHMWYTPNITKGITTCSFDLRFDMGSIICNEWRDASNPFRVGPSFTIDATGTLNVNNEKLMVLPPEQWIHFETVGGLGKQNNGTWTLAVTVSGQPAQKFENLSCDPKLKELIWLGFVSNAEEKTVFYIDNIKLNTVEPE